MTSTRRSIEDQLWQYVTSKQKSPNQSKQLYSILALSVLDNVSITPAVLKKYQTFERWFDMITLPRFRIGFGMISQQTNFHLSSTSALTSTSTSTSTAITTSQFPWFNTKTTIQEMVNNLRNSMSKSRTLAKVLQSDEAKRILGEALVKVQAAVEQDQALALALASASGTSTGKSIKKKKKKHKNLPRITYDRRDEFSYRGSHYDLDSDIDIEDEIEDFDDKQSYIHDYGDDDYETTEEEPKSENEDAVATESSSDIDHMSVEVDILVDLDGQNESAVEDEEVQEQDQVQMQMQMQMQLDREACSEAHVEDDVASMDSWDIVSDDHSIISMDDDAEVPFSYKDAILMKRKEADQDTRSRIKANFDTNNSKPLTQVAVILNEDHILPQVECNEQEEQNLFDPDFFREKYSRGQKKKGRMRKNQMKRKS
jgi:hypothetical protein